MPLRVFLVGLVILCGTPALGRAACPEGAGPAICDLFENLETAEAQLVRLRQVLDGQKTMIEAEFEGCDGCTDEELADVVEREAVIDSQLLELDGKAEELSRLMCDLRRQLAEATDSPDIAEDCALD